MNPNLSLDDIIRINKKKGKTGNIKNERKRANGKRSKPRATRKNESRMHPKAGIQTSSKTSFKSKSAKARGKKLSRRDARLKISGSKSGVVDARFKLLRDQNRHAAVQLVKNSSLNNKSNVIDARQRILAHRKKVIVPKPQPEKRIPGTTILAPNGIIQRRINVRNSFNNDVSLEYDDDLEFATLKEDDWRQKALLVRTIHNRPIKSSLKYSSFNDDSMQYENSDGSPSYRNDTEYSGTRMKEVTRTFRNSNFTDAPSSRKTSRRSSPLYLYSHEEDQEMHSAPPLSHPSPMNRNPYHLLLISNLHEKVTREDIKELFEDIGDLVYAKMKKSGVAEVAYKSKEDAMKAVEIYHNRQLDGLPMKCTLVSNNQDSYRYYK